VYGIFIFRKLQAEDLRPFSGIGGNKWIKTIRTKTKSTVNIPILSTAMNIIIKYKNHPEVVKR